MSRLRKENPGKSGDELKRGNKGDMPESDLAPEAERAQSEDSTRGRGAERARSSGMDRGLGFGFGRRSSPGHEHGHERGAGRGRGHEHDNKLFGANFPEGATATERAMISLMMTVKMIHRFRESRISQDKRFSKLSGPRMGVLFMVHHSGGLRMGDLAAKLHVAPRTVTDLVDGLEKDGFLHRIPDPRDRRASILELSALAKKDFEHLSQMRNAFVEEIFSPLNDGEKDRLCELLSKLREGPIRTLLSEDFDRFEKE